MISRMMSTNGVQVLPLELLPKDVIVCSSEKLDWPAYPAASVADGSPYTGWHVGWFPGSNLPHWIGYTYVVSKSCSQVRLASHPSFLNYAPKSFVVQGWDGSSWISIPGATYLNITYDLIDNFPVFIGDFPTVSYKGYRIYMAAGEVGAELIVGGLEFKG